MRKSSLVFGVLLTATTAMGQRTLEKVIQKLSGKEVPLASVTEVAVNPSYLRLDAREREEYDVSHLPNAYYIGYDEFDPGVFAANFPDRGTTYVVYCSVGIRSGRIAKKLMDLGYSDVRNLSGGIFKWVEEGKRIVDSHNKFTRKVHAYNRFWGMLLKNGEKVYGPEIEEADEG